ncbi:MAG: hypothetical protein M0Z99_04995 [Betaproteobacteria bacterium]|nr:hypothetical protein [Betaproteobacteria bacterium]
MIVTRKRCGYCDALAWIHQDAQQIPISNETNQRLHAMTRGHIWDAGLYKEKDGDIIERYPDGQERVRFRTVPAQETPAAMTQLVSDWQTCIEDRWVPPLRACPGVSRDMIRRVLNTQKGQTVDCIGRGPGALWQKSRIFPANGRQGTW